MGSTGNQNSRKFMNMDSTRIQNSRKFKNMDSTPVAVPVANHDQKRRCLEKLVVRKERNVEDVNCALDVEVIDDTALIEATASVNRFKNRFKKETDVGLKNDSRIGGCKYQKKENDGKKKRNKGSKKPIKGCSMKCLNEKKGNDRVVADRKSENVKKVDEGKSQKVFKKVYGKVKYVYKRKDATNPTTSVDEHQKVASQNVPEKIVAETLQETEAKLDSRVKIVVGEGVKEAEVNLKVTNGHEKELAIELVKTETVNVKDDVSDVQAEKNEAESRNVSENSSVGVKKIVYSREEMEALRFVDEVGQKSKWNKLYNAFEPSVAREYTGLVIGVNNWPTQRSVSARGMENVKVASRLSCKWSCGTGPRIGCVRDYPPQLQSRALEQINLSPRVGTTNFANYGPIPSPRSSPKVRLSPRLSYMGLPSPRTPMAAAKR
ncbi:uncharacterized protein [Rutidosis leptorrhynchoides]|uniref:uncharacterized protein n=1 Tax=Rutidosis leptorrhynchoides TaxID=125765 RepID=UPI003A98D5C4